MVYAHVFRTVMGKHVAVTGVVAHAVRVPLAHANPTENVNALQYALRKIAVIAILRPLQQVATSQMLSKYWRTVMVSVGAVSIRVLTLVLSAWVKEKQLAADVQQAQSRDFVKRTVKIAEKFAPLNAAIARAWVIAATNIMNAKVSQRRPSLDIIGC